MWVIIVPTNIVKKKKNTWHSMKNSRKDKLIGICLANIPQFMTNKVVQIENNIGNIKIKLADRYIIKILDYKWNKYIYF